MSVDGKPFRMVVLRPERFRRAVIMANGAGAGMDSEFISYFHEGLAGRGFLSVKFNFPYQEQSRSGPDRSPVLEATYLAVIDFLKDKEKLSAAKIVGAGKSMGGRIGSMVAERAGLRRLMFLGYPLHPPGKPERLRDSHLYALQAKLLFVSGTRDPLCERTLLDQVAGKLKQAQVIFIEGGDHSLKVPRRAGVSAEDVRESILNSLVRFAR